MTHEYFNALNCTCLGLRQASRRVGRLYDKYLEAASLKNTQFSLLAQLTWGDFSVAELADRMVLDPTTLTRNLQPLTARGLVEIRVGQDRRRRLIHLTEEGRAAFEMALPHWREAQTHIKTVFGKESRQTLHRLLESTEKLPLPA